MQPVCSGKSGKSSRNDDDDGYGNDDGYGVAKAYKDIQYMGGMMTSKRGKGSTGSAKANKDNGYSHDDSYSDNLKASKHQLYPLSSKQRNTKPTLESTGKPTPKPSGKTTAFPTMPLGGYPPFYADNEQELFCLTKNGKFQFDKEHWSDISIEAKVLILSLLVVDPSQRASAEEILANPWINQKSDDLLRKSLLVSQSALKSYRAKMRFKKAIHW